MGTVSDGAVVSTCAACGATTMDPGHWLRRFGNLLCPYCAAVLSARSDDLVRHICAAERGWDELWQMIETALDTRAS